jgi:type VI secretion system secreted protein Hcp
VTGKSVEATIDLVSEGSVYLRVTMKGTLISSYQISGSGDKPTESLTLNFTEVVFEQNPGGPPPKFK